MKLVVNHILPAADQIWHNPEMIYWNCVHQSVQYYVWFKAYDNISTRVNNIVIVNVHKQARDEII